mmetsp:Transcript_1067/g.1657  ORF Transcript_1067/g.1657 Transcript_1067/m.1657 type:complete len:196 (+) Transcript_1067:27-614(+)
MTMIALRKHMYNMFRAICEFDVTAIESRHVPQKRGKFNPHEVYPIVLNHHSYADVKDATELSSLERYAKITIEADYEASKYREYGLLYDDLLHDEDAVVVEAINRLPEATRIQRENRIARAQQLNVLHETLPEEEWTKAENDLPYLSPYVEWVRNEMIEYDYHDWSRSGLPINPPPIYSPGDFNDGSFRNKRLIP